LNRQVRWVSTLQDLIQVSTFSFTNSAASWGKRLVFPRAERHWNLIFSASMYPSLPNSSRKYFRNAVGSALPRTRIPIFRTAARKPPPRHHRPRRRAAETRNKLPPCHTQDRHRLSPLTTYGSTGS
jgi:hypothetical protein